MKVQPPCKVSQEEIVFQAAEIEALLQAPPMELKPLDPCWINLKGNDMVIREAKEEEIDLLLQYMRQILNSDQFTEGKDYYDIVTARIYAELLGVKRKRLKDPYTFVGCVDGELVAFCNGRLFDEDINISLHTLALKRGMRAGAVMYYAKCQYCFEQLGQQEFWATYESINGLKRWGLGMCQPSYPWPDMQHELGGAKIFYITREYWDARVKNYLSDMVGAEVQRPVPEELLEKNSVLRLPEGVNI